MIATNTRTPGRASAPDSPLKGARSHEPAVALAERRRTGEQAEVDREAVAVPRPHLATEAGHPEPHHVAVERDRERERPRVGGVRVGELERGEREQHRGRGIDAEALRVGPERLPRAAEPAPYPVDTVRGRTPRIQDRPDVPEEDLQYGHAQPEDDVDERRREVDGGRRLADERGQEDEREEPDRDGAGNDPQPRRAEEPLEALAAAASRPRAARAAAASRACRARGTRRRGRRCRPRGRARPGPAGPGSHRCRARRSRRNNHGVTDRSAIWTPRPRARPRSDREWWRGTGSGRASRAPRRPSGRSRAGECGR